MRLLRDVLGVAAVTAIVFGCSGDDSSESGSNCAAFGRSDCFGQCADLMTNPFHCGACNHACGAGMVCAQGACVTEGSAVGGTGGATGGSGGVAPGGTGGIIPGGTGGVTPGGTGGVTPGGTGGTVVTPGTWHAVTSATAQSSLASEYATWKSGYYRDCGNGTACVEDTFNGRCVSEGVAYGMLLAVNMDDRAAFDALWGYYTGHLNDNGVMHWETQTCGGVWSQNGATDAELDAAMALIQADARWGGYLGDAQNLINAIRIHETETCGAMIVLKPGDAWGGCSDGGTVNPSYFAPAYYRVFAVVDAGNAAHWNQLTTDTYTLWNQWQPSQNGLMCGWANLNGGCTSGYDWDAVRVPWRVATDYAWFGDAGAAQVLQGMRGYIDSNGGIAGVPYDPNSAFRGSLALAGMSADQGTFDTYVQGWMSSATQDDAYFQATLRVLYLMLAAGQFPSTL